MSKSKDERLADVRRQIEAARDALDAMEREIDALSARQSRGDGAIRCLPSGRWQAKVKVGGSRGARQCWDCGTTCDERDPCPCCRRRKEIP